MDRILTLIGGIFWVITYIEIIRCGIRDKTCSMPLIAIGLNFSWKLLFLINNKFNDIKILFLINIIWIVLDLAFHLEYDGKISASSCVSFFQNTVMSILFFEK